MKTIGVNLEESEIEELLEVEKTDSKSDALRLVIKEWKEQKKTIADQYKNILFLEHDLEDARYRRSLKGFLIILISTATISLPLIALALFKLYFSKP